MKSALKIALTYGLIASLWIIFSDTVIAAMTDNAAALRIYSSVKGMFFVAVTGGLLYFQVRAEIEAKNRVIRDLDREMGLREDLIRELHHRIKNNMQVVLSLINIEARESEALQAVRERLSNKLLSMMSVFNIVYDLRDMAHISLDRVLEEYRKISVRRIILEKERVDARYSIETITSVMLLVDSILEAYCRPRDLMSPIAISSPRGGLLLLRFPPGTCVQGCLSEEDQDFVEIQLASLSGRMKLDGDTMSIEFTDRTEAFPSAG